MYRQHFSLSRLPFEAPACSDELFRSQAAEETETRLRHLLELRGIGLLTGEPGSGKTSLCRRVADSLHPSQYRVCYVSLTTGSVIDIYQSIAWELGLQAPRYRAEARHAIQAEIARLAREARTLPVLVIDEARHLRHDVLEELKLLTNFEMDSRRLLCLLLAGLTELRRKLAMAVNESLAQRIVVRQQLEGLRPEELEPCLQHCLRLAGCELQLFDKPACEALLQASRGLPRLLNRLAHFSLAAAALDEARSVAPRHVEHACQEVRP